MTFAKKSKATTSQKYMGEVKPIPGGLTTSEWEDLNKLWDSVLKSDGFKDIEYRDPKTNRVLPVFRNSTSPSGSATSVASKYERNFSKYEYYRMCSIFLEHAPWRRLFGKKRPHALYRKMFELHTDGKDYRTIAKYFRGPPCPKKWRRPKASEFWTHWTLQNVIERMFKWHREDPEGLLYTEQTNWKPIELVEGEY